MAQISPSITSLTPFNTHVGDTVVISGTGFDLSNISNNQVYFTISWYISPNVFERDSVTAKIVSVTATSLTVVVPSISSQGKISVFINGQFATSVNGVYYNVVPTISNFVPDHGYIGDTITITGTGFNAGPHAWFNNVWFTNGNNTTAFSSTPISLKVVVPINSNTGPITVFTNTPKVTSTSNFTVLPSIQPSFFTSGEVGTQLTIYGNGLDPSQVGNYEVRFNGVLAKIDLMTSYSINTSVPAHASTGPVTLTWNGNPVKGSGFLFTVTPTMPSVTSYSVYSGSVGTPVAIVGSGFDQAGPPLQVAFGGVAAKIISYSSTSINTSVPLGAASAPISVSVAGVTAEGQNMFRVIERVSGANLTHAGIGDTLTIRGDGFQKGTSYYYVIFPGLGVQATAFGATDTSIKYIIPSSATSSAPLLKSNFSLAVSVTLPYLSIIPTISSLDPDTVFIGRPDQWLYINGTGFGLPSSQATVTFTNNVQTHYNVINQSPTRLKVAVPPNIITGPVTVRIDSLTSAPKVNLIVLPDTLPYRPLPPLIASPNPITITSFTCRWLKTYRAIGYLLDASVDNFKTYLSGFHAKSLTDTSQAFSGLSAGTKYQIRIRAFSKTDTSDYGGAVIVTIPPAPVAFAPQRLSQLEFTLQWHAAKGATGYNLEVSADSFGNNLVSSVYDTTEYLRIIDINKAPTFEYRLRAFNDFGTSEYSNVIVVAVITDVTSSSSEIAVFPNPSTDYIQVLGVSGRVIESTVVDETGKTSCADLVNENGGAPSLDVHSLAKGLYVLRFRTEQSVISVKFVKQ